MKKKRKMVMRMMRMMKKKKKNMVKKKIPVALANVTFGGKKLSEVKRIMTNQLMKISFEQTCLAESSFFSYVKDALPS